MPIILCRHGATAKNIEGGQDDRSTPLHEEGIRQSLAAGNQLSRFCHENGLARVQPITSGYDRTNASCDLALQGFAASDIEILPRIEDRRIAEIKFHPREVTPTADVSGIFGRVINGLSLSEVLQNLRDFDRDHLKNVSLSTCLVAFGHRTTHRLLAMVHLQQDIAWMEDLPRMDNCELWQLNDGRISVIHPGYAAVRDEPDLRRQTLKTQN